MSYFFSKYSACGNDFILFDHRSPFMTPYLVTRLCERKNGIGADGVILLEQSTNCDLKMRIFNADGSEAEMCGNGLRCLALFSQEVGFQKNRLQIETMEKILGVEILQEGIKAEMGVPHSIRTHICLNLKNHDITAHFINTGVPHVVIFVDELSQIDLLNSGSLIRNHPEFAPKGTNVNFVKILGDQKIAIRTYERGVEDETSACGTGATASAILSTIIYPHLISTHTPISVTFSSKEAIAIDLITDQTSFIKYVSQTGPARKKFSGTIDLKEFL